MMKKIFMSALILMCLWNTGFTAAAEDVREVVLSMEELALSLNIMNEAAEREQDAEMNRITDSLKAVYIKESTAGREKASLFLSRNRACIFLMKLKKCRIAACDSVMLRDIVFKTAEAFREEKDHGDSGSYE